MSDTYPANITIEIDRPLLRRYLRMKWSRGLVILIALLCGIFGFAGSVDHLPDHITSPVGAALFVAEVLAISLALSLVVSVILYFLFVHRSVVRYAESLHLSVEGPFLRIREHGLVLIDRKIHFRSIHDYSTLQDSL